MIGPDKKPLRGIGVGEYTLCRGRARRRVQARPLRGRTDGDQEVLLETRKFIVNRYVPDMFEKKLEFDGKSLRAGRRRAGPHRGLAHRGRADEGREGQRRRHRRRPRRSTSRTASSSRSSPAERRTKAVLDVRFKLPADIFETAKTDTPPNATLSVNIQDGSDAEPIVRPIPLVTKNLKVEFFPEGGEMIDGVPGRVYFQVRTPARQARRPEGLHHRRHETRSPRSRR